LSKVDIVLLIVAALGAWNGYREGFLMEIVSLVGIILGIFLGFKLMGEGMIFLEEKFNVDRATLPYVSFIVIFLLVIFGVRLLGRLLKNSLDKSFLGSADQALGGALGVLRALFMVSVVIWLLDSLRLHPRQEWVEGSWLYPFTANLAPAMAEWAGRLIPVFREVFRDF
jgi:membrane protein required for colicin V production